MDEDNKPPDYREIGQALEAFCNKYAIPLEHFFDIINDQKVLPMLRGKGLEYHVFILLKQYLDRTSWEVSKLNLSAQQGFLDEDITVTHRRTGIKITVESKHAARGSMSKGGTRTKKKTPHFKVKCHRSRSNTKLLGAGNDRYKSTDFDVLVTNPSNALYQKGTIGEELELLDNQDTIELLRSYYQSPEDQIIQCVANDWRFVLTSNIAEQDDLIPRNPVVLLQNDPHWLSLTSANLQSQLEELVRQKMAERRKHSRSSK